MSSQVLATWFVFSADLGGDFVAAEGGAGVKRHGYDMTR